MRETSKNLKITNTNTFTISSKLTTTTPRASTTRKIKS